MHRSAARIKCSHRAFGTHSERTPGMSFVNPQHFNDAAQSTERNAVFRTVFQAHRRTHRPSPKELFGWDSKPIARQSHGVAEARLKEPRTETPIRPFCGSVFAVARLSDILHGNYRPQDATSRFIAHQASSIVPHFASRYNTMERMFCKLLVNGGIFNN